MPSQLPPARLEQMVSRLRQFKLMTMQGATECEALSLLGLTHAAHKRMQKEVAGSTSAIDPAKLLRVVRQENFELREQLAELALATAVLRDRLNVCGRSTLAD